MSNIWVRVGDPWVPCIDVGVNVLCKKTLENLFIGKDCPFWCFFLMETNEHHLRVFMPCHVCGKVIELWNRSQSVLALVNQFVRPLEVVPYQTSLCVV